MRDLLDAALIAYGNAHAPYSGFQVGAAVRTPSGRIFAGANVENASFPEGNCAETSALAAMIAAGERRIVEVLVVAAGERLCTPCGGCRQRLFEFGAPGTLVHLCDPGGLRRTVTLGELLPLSFVLDDDAAGQVPATAIDVIQAAAPGVPAPHRADPGIRPRCAGRRPGGCGHALLCRPARVSAPDRGGP